MTKSYWIGGNDCNGPTCADDRAAVTKKTLRSILEYYSGLEQYLLLLLESVVLTIPPEDLNNSSETRLCRVSDKIIQVRGWDFLVPQQYIMMDTFSRPLCDFLRLYMNSVSSAYIFRFLRLFQSKK